MSIELFQLRQLPIPFALIGYGVLALSAVILSLWESIAARWLGGFRFVIALLAVIGGIVACAWQWLQGGVISLAFLEFDRFGTLIAAFILFATLASLLQIYGVRARAEEEGEAVYGLLLMSALGALVGVFSNDLIGIFLALELNTLPLIVGIQRRAHRRNTALSYFVSSGLTSLLFLFGLILLYSLTGETSIARIAEQMTSGPPSRLEALALVMLLSGLAFKMAWFPFHFINADLYEGYRKAGISFVAIVPKLLGIAVLLRMISLWGLPAKASWHQLLTVMAVLTMTVGNLKAFGETHLKRRLAFAAMAQAGFALLGLVAFTSTVTHHEEALTAVVFYLLAYVLMTAGVFACVVALGREGDEPMDITDLSGLGGRHPWLAGSLSLLLLSWAGLPPTIGFIGKISLLQSTLGAGNTVLAFVALLNWALAAITLLDLVSAIYFRSSRDQTIGRVGYPLHVVIFAACLLVLYWGLFPSNILTIARESVRALLY